MLDTYRSRKGNFDGVIFAHGTDTLAFSAALFSLMPKEIPVFFVSSNARLDSSRANGNQNFRCAVECICKGIAPGVYVPYKNISSGKMLLHYGSRIKQCPNYSEDFESDGAIDLSAGEVLPQKMSIEKALPKNLWDKLRLKDNVLVLQPYVGLNYEAVDYGRFSAVLHGTYHSGTACTEGDKNSILRMLDLCKGKADVYLSPSKAEGEIYDTVRVIAEHGDVEFLYGDTFELAYAKLLVAYSLFDNKEDIIKFVKG
jgi:L-asparaginase